MSNSLIQYWDSDVLIHALQRTPGHLAELEPLITEAENGNIQILLSTFTLMEIYKDLDGVNAISKEDDELITAFFENPYFIFKDVTHPIALSTRQISREFGIKPKDAVHVATALYYNVPVLFSYDDGLLKKSGKIGNPPLEIIKPFWTGQPTLVGMDLEQVEDAENAQVEQSEISLSEQINEKENIEIEQTTTAAIEESTIGVEQE